MDWKKALGFGFVVWIVMFVLAYILMAAGLVSGSAAFGVTLGVLCLVAVFVVAKYLAPSSGAIAIQYGLAFAVVGIILDYLVTTRFAPDVFSSMYYWVTYVLIVFVPMLAVKKSSI